MASVASPSEVESLPSLWKVTCPSPCCTFCLFASEVESSLPSFWKVTCPSPCCTFCFLFCAFVAGACSCSPLQCARFSSRCHCHPRESCSCSAGTACGVLGTLGTAPRTGPSCDFSLQQPQPRAPVHGRAAVPVQVTASLAYTRIPPPDKQTSPSPQPERDRAGPLPHQSFGLDPGR